MILAPVRVPTSVEAAIRRIENVESAEGRRDEDRDEQSEAYEKTLRAPEDATPDDVGNDDPLGVRRPAPNVTNR